MATKNDGGPAFAQLDTDAGGKHRQIGGMTLRDWFAGQALAGLSATAETGEWTFKEIAKFAYDQADAMIAERSK